MKTPPESIYDSTDALYDVSVRWNAFIGLIIWCNSTRAWHGQMNAHIVETYNEYNTRTGENLLVLVWEDEEQRKVNLALQLHNNWINGGSVGPEPALYVAKSIPQNLQDQLDALPQYLIDRQAWIDEVNRLGPSSCLFIRESDFGEPVPDVSMPQANASVPWVLRGKNVRIPVIIPEE